MEITGQRLRMLVIIFSKKGNKVVLLINAMVNSVPMLINVKDLNHKN